MAGKQAVKRSVLKVPQDLTEAAEFVRQIGEAQRAIADIESGLNHEVESLKAKAVKQTQPLDEQLVSLRDGLYAFAEGRRNELTEGGKRKSVEVPSGIFGWRMTPPAVSLRNVHLILVKLKELGLTRFIRTTEEVDKEAMLKEQGVAGKVKGISIGQHEEFFVKPAEVGTEIKADARKLKKAIT